MAIAKVILILFAAFIFYKTFILYKKTQKIIPLFISLSFVATIISSAFDLDSIDSSKITKLLKLETETSLIKAEKKEKKEIDMNKNKESTIIKFIRSTEINQVFGFLAFLLIMLAFYKKTKQPGTKKRKAPKVMISLASVLLLLLVLCNTLHYAVDPPSLYLLKFKTFIFSATALMFIVGVINLGTFAYKASNKSRAYYYLNEAFVFLVLGIPIITVAASVPIAFFANNKAVLPYIILAPAAIIFTLTCYIYHLILKAIHIFEKNPSQI